MQLELTETGDGSLSIFSHDFGETYHSINGAINESLHIFIDCGFKCIDKQEIRILEIGFGTGLNAFLTYLEAQKLQKIVCYTAIELFPLPECIYELLNYVELIEPTKALIFKKLHEVAWDEEVEIEEGFAINKIRTDLVSYCFANDKLFDLVYFDAFAPDTQPEMWTHEIFEKIYKTVAAGGILTTYSSKGTVKQNLRNAGFKVNRLKGPTGKRHILRAEKI